MKTRARKQWIAGAALGGMIVGSVALAGGAVADEVVLADEDITIGVDIEALEPVGALTLSVETDAVQLTESTNEELAADGLREFTGTLTGVSVSDTRDVVAGWSVAVQSSPDFESEDGGTISSEFLGWAPALVSGDGGGDVQAGEPIAGDLEENPEGWLDGGLQIGDLLVSAGLGVNGTFEAEAGLNLTVDDDVEAGSYTSVLTISLFDHS